MAKCAKNVKKTQQNTQRGAWGQDCCYSSWFYSNIHKRPSKNGRFSRKPQGPVAPVSQSASPPARAPPPPPRWRQTRSRPGSRCSSRARRSAPHSGRWGRRPPPGWRRRSGGPAGSSSWTPLGCPGRGPSLCGIQKLIRNPSLKTYASASNDLLIVFHTFCRKNKNKTIV